MKYRHALLAATVAALLSPLGLSAEEAAKKVAEEKPQKVAQVECAETVTGSRIRAARPAKDAVKDATKDKDKQAKCMTSSYPMRTWTKEDLEMTGQTDLAEALRQLDPAFR